MSIGKTISLVAADGHRLSAYLVEPAAETPVVETPKEGTKAGLVILQEIFGVTGQMKKLAERFAQHGYRTIVPALFDRVAPDSVIPYDEADQGRALAGKCKPDNVLMDIQTAADRVNVDNRVSVIGFCWGGTYAFLSACELKISSAVAYYGTRIVEQLDKKPKCPLLFHFGEKDNLISDVHIAQIRAANPSLPTYVYPGAGHAFANADRPSYHPESARVAEERTLEFLAQTAG